MPTLLLILSVPILGGLLLLVDYHLRTNATRDEQDFYKFVIRGLGAALCVGGLSVTGVMFFLGSGGVVAQYLAEWFVRGLVAMFGLLAAFGGLMAEAYGRARPPKTLREEARQDRNASLFRLSCWMVLLTPLAAFLPPVFIVAPMIATTVLTIWRANSRGHEASLLWRLAIATENGLPIADEVEAAATDASVGKQAALLGLADRLRNGRSLADSLEVGPRLVPRPVILAIRAAERTDGLADVLRRAADRSVREIGDAGGPRDGLPFQAYIANVCLIVMLVVAFLTYWIVPKFKSIFNDFGIELPASTKMLIGASTGFADFWFLLLPIVTVPVGVLMLPAVISLLGWQNLNVPLLMRWFPRRDGPPILRALSVAIEQERPLPEFLGELAGHHHRDDMRGRLGRIAETVRQGEDPWTVFGREGFLRKPEVAALTSASAAGHLPWALRSVADVIEHRQRVREAWWTEWQRPIVVFCLAALVGFICIAMFTPIIEVIESIE
jgi:type II secretory pathway component PulF